MSTKTNIVDKVAEDFEGRPGLATFFGIRPQAIQPWVRDGFFPPSRAIELERRFPDRYKAVDLAAPGDREEIERTTQAA
jgi:hypothetical protein